MAWDACSFHVLSMWAIAPLQVCLLQLRNSPQRQHYVLPLCAQTMWAINIKIELYPSGFQLWYVRPCSWCTSQGLRASRGALQMLHAHLTTLVPSIFAWTKHSVVSSCLMMGTDQNGSTASWKCCEPSGAAPGPGMNLETVMACLKLLTAEFPMTCSRGAICGMNSSWPEWMPVILHHCVEFSDPGQRLQLQSLSRQAKSISHSGSYSYLTFPITLILFLTR